MRTLCVGDVHGCNDELGDLLQFAGWSSADNLVLVGDLVAKGPDSAGVVHRARELGARAVLGNHEEHLLNVRLGQVHNERYAKLGATLRPEDWTFLESLPLWIDLPEYNGLLVHGGLLPHHKPAQHPKHLLLNMRSIDADGKASMRVTGGVPWASLWTGPQHVIFGHDAMRGLQQYPFATGLDTGCVYGKRLTGLWLPEHRLVSVPARKAWHPTEA